jgi:hypothetical protein
MLTNVNYTDANAITDSSEPTPSLTIRCMVLSPKPDISASIF